MTLAGCGKGNSSDTSEDSTVESPTENSAVNENIEENSAEDQTGEWTDYTEQIKTEVADAASSNTLQKELETISALANKYDEICTNSETQTDMNYNSQWPYMVWDTELNSLWSRMSDELDPSTKEEVLAKQRVWVSMKETAADNLSATYIDGTIYSTIRGGELANITCRRVYVLAEAFAKFKGESFSMPARDNFGYFVDTQGTSDEYSSMTVIEGMEADSIDIKISIYRQGEITGFGTATEDGITFESYDGNVKGTIGVRYDGASFKVTEAKDAIVNTGDSYEFDLAF